MSISISIAQFQNLVESFILRLDFIIRVGQRMLKGLWLDLLAFVCSEESIFLFSDEIFCSLFGFVGIGKSYRLSKDSK